MSKMTKQSSVPLWNRMCLTISEASELSGIGEKNLRKLVKEHGNDFVIQVGRKTMVKRSAFEKWLSLNSEL